MSRLVNDFTLRFLEDTQGRANRLDVVLFTDKQARSGQFCVKGLVVSALVLSASALAAALGGQQARLLLDREMPGA